ncbi:CoA-disulfide reductase [Paenisporosarcina quisquiliarum]|uniref:CoA-disulfide reductase n=1 Tax=Paenisporosarcina quisquiliarum TaxID=365346 RepID=UPI00373578FB
MPKIVVVGAVAGGATVASQIRYLDKDSSITVFDQDETMSFAACGMPYYLGGHIENEQDLIATTPEKFKDEKNIIVNMNHRVMRIDREKKIVEVKDLLSNKTFEDAYDVLILSPGGTPIVPKTDGLESAKVFTLRNFEDMRNIHSFIEAESPKSCVIVGAGFIGLEMAENLVELGMKVTLVEKSPQVMNILDVDSSDIVEKELHEHGVKVYKENFITHVDGRNITLDQCEKLEADFILMSVGVSPSTELASEAGLTIGDTRGIVTNEFMQTNDSAIYALGDAAENKDFITGQPKRVPLAWPAHRQAYIVANHIAGQEIPFKGMLGTSIAKVFDLSVGMTGLGERNLNESDLYFKTITQKSKSNAGYYPDHGDLFLKIHYDAENRKVLGAQVVGEKGVDKRIDVIATAIYAGLTIDDLQALELAYAPPYSSPKDPVNMASYRAK